MKKIIFKLKDYNSNRKIENIFSQANHSVPSYLQGIMDVGMQTCHEILDKTKQYESPSTNLFIGKLSIDEIAALGEVLTEINSKYPLNLSGPFEKNEKIIGDAWRSSLVPEREISDGLTMLEFSSGTIDLPMHSHPASDRFIIVLEGEGTFHASFELPHSFSGDKVFNIPVTCGSILSFTRNFMHTFSSKEQSLKLLSYHSHFFEFDDLMQYFLPKVHWVSKF